jgi:dTDP-4-dehydrorhamnose reductase
MRIVVVGANGQLGRSIVASWSPHHEVAGFTRLEADLMNPSQVRALLLGHRPQVIINCAAYNNVDGAEDDQRTAIEVNGLAVRTLARAAADVDAILVHYSTDFVFSGSASEPYTEDDTPEPQSVYSQSKLIGEWMAAICPKHFVLRVESLFGGPAARSSVDLIAAALRHGRPTRVFRDRWVSPSFVDDVADATAFVVKNGVPFGLYHCVNSGVATWLQVGEEIARRLNRDASVLDPVSVSDIKLRAVRPRYAALDNGKLSRAGFAMPTWQDALSRYLDRADA